MGNNSSARGSCPCFQERPGDDAGNVAGDDLGRCNDFSARAGHQYGKCQSP